MEVLALTPVPQVRVRTGRPCPSPALTLHLTIRLSLQILMVPSAWSLSLVLILNGPPGLDGILNRSVVTGTPREHSLGRGGRQDTPRVGHSWFGLSPHLGASKRSR